MAAKTTTKKKNTTKKSAPKKAEAPKRWEVARIPVAYATLFAAYKLRDESKPDEENNRFYCGGFWQTEKEAQALADRYNKEGKE